MIALLLMDVIRLSFKALTEKRFRAILTIIGIMIGPLALVTIYSVTSGYGKFIVNQISGLGQNLVVVTPENINLDDKDLEKLLNIPGVVDASPFITLQGVVRKSSGEMNIYIYAVKYDFLFKSIPSLKIKEGGIPSETDIVKCIVGYNIAFNDNDELEYGVGDALSIKVRVFKEKEIKEINTVLIISSILDKYGGAALLNPDTTVFISIDTARRIFRVNEWSGILLYVEDTTLISNVTSAIREMYGSSVSVTSFYAIAQIAQSITGAVNFMTFSASLSAFAVAVAGIAATMITSVIERTREIGVMKALGFTDRQVLILIIFEGVIMALIGGSTGIVLGVIGAHILASRGLVIRAGAFTLKIKASPDLNPLLLLNTMALTILIGIIGSIFPAYRASKIPPAVALRYE